MTAVSELKEKFKKCKWYNFRNCLTCEHCRVYFDNENHDSVVCLKKHDIPPKGLPACDDYKDDAEGVML